MHPRMIITVLPQFYLNITHVILLTRPSRFSAYVQNWKAGWSLWTRLDFCMSPITSEIRAVKNYWHMISLIKELSGVELRYPVLTRLAKAILVVPHGNADTECLFSHIGLNKAKHQNCLSIDTLNQYFKLTVNNAPQKCYEFQPTKELVCRCKNAIGELNLSSWMLLAQRYDIILNIVLGICTCACIIIVSMFNIRIFAWIKWMFGRIWW